MAEKVVASPITHRTNVRMVDKFSVKELIRLWKQSFSIDISLQAISNYEFIELYECLDSNLLFFYPFDISGNEHLYSSLSRFEWYYMSDKWEHKVAISDLVNAKKVLEIGSGSGAFVQKALRNKINVFGLELNHDAVQEAKRKCLPVEAADLHEFSSKNANSFDAICSFQVLEHVSDPHNFLISCLNLLESGGKLILSTPNANSFLKHQFNLLDMPPHHVTKWCTRTFQSLQKIYPLKLEKVINEPLQKYHISSFIQAYKSNLINLYPILKPLLNRYTTALFEYTLRFGLRSLCTGQSIYALYKKI